MSMVFSNKVLLLKQKYQQAEALSQKAWLDMKTAEGDEYRSADSQFKNAFIGKYYSHSKPDEMLQKDEQEKLTIRHHRTFTIRHVKGIQEDPPHRLIIDEMQFTSNQHSMHGNWTEVRIQFGKTVDMIMQPEEMGEEITAQQYAEIKEKVLPHIVKF